MKLKNTLFGSESNRSDIPKYNACVGNNGWVGMHSYIDGFQSSTVILLESLIKDVDKEDFDGFMWCLDTCVYPILFSARHFLELFLKQQVLRISYLKNQSEDNYEIKLKLLKTHDTHKLWKLFLTEIKSVFDIRLNQYLHKIHIFILQFHNIDSTGETFRYPYSQTNSPHLTNHSVIGLKRFYKQFLEFSKVASEFSYLTHYLLQEYKVGTYTEHLSRDNIEEIALLLPKKNNWTNRNLKQYQSYVKDKYGAGCREFRDVLEIIKSNIEFNNIVSDEYKLEIDEHKLIKFCLNSAMKVQEDLGLSLNDLACIRAIQEISIPVMDGRYFSEDISWLKTKYLKEYSEYSAGWMENEVAYVYRNNYRTIRGLVKLRQMNTLGKLKKAYLNLLLCLIEAHKNEPTDVSIRIPTQTIEDIFLQDVVD